MSVMERIVGWPYDDDDDGTDDIDSPITLDEGL